jgi:hypothetical protein
MERYDEILLKIDENRIQSDNRHNEAKGRHAETNLRLDSLIASITSWTDKETAAREKAQQHIEEVKTAFLMDDLNRTDFNGHRLAHKDMIESSRQTRQSMKQIVMIVAGAAAVSVSAWVWISLKASATEHLVQQQQNQQERR